MFAKIFETKEHGQILVKKDQDEKGCPEIRLYFEPEDFGVCSLGISFSDSDKGDDSRDAFFSNVDEVRAIAMVSKVKAKSGIE